MTTIRDARRELWEPRYSYGEADYLANVSRGTSKRWLVGYQYHKDGEARTIPSVTPHVREPGAVSFIDLVEVAAIGRLKGEAGFSLQEIRRIVHASQAYFGVERPLATLKFKVGGGEAFVVMSDDTLLEVFGKRRGETAWYQILEPFLEELEYDDTGWATRWWPLGRSQAIVVDPAYAYGLPVVAGSGVRLEVILERTRAGDLPEVVAEDFSLTREQVDRALQFELKRAA